VTRSDAGYASVYGKPDWSPDGQRMAFAAFMPSGDLEIVTVNASDGANMVDVSQNAATNTQGYDMHPSWSPDGTRIAYASYRVLNGYGKEIWISRADGGGDHTRVTDDTSEDQLPIWSPDGGKLLFASSRDGDRHGGPTLMFVVDAPALGASAIPTAQRVDVPGSFAQPSDWSGVTVSNTLGPNGGTVTLGPAGGTVTLGTVTTANVVAPSITTSGAGPVSITVDPSGSTAPTGYTLVGSQYDIIAPAVDPATGSPLRIAFDLNSSTFVPGDLASLNAVAIMRNGTVIPDCNGRALVADPEDVCVLSRSVDSATGVGTVVVQSWHASGWRVVRKDRAPTCNAVRASTTSEQPVTVTMSCSDPDGGDRLNYSIVNPPAVAQGTLGPVGGGKVTFTPNEDFAGSASLTFKATDGILDSNVATATVTVRRTCGGLTPTLVGSSANNTLKGTTGRDVISGLGGDDRIDGGLGDDVICGGSANDTISAGLGADRLFGGSGNDRLDGGLGNDALDGGLGTDRCDGGLGANTKTRCEA
jgi:Ca2+-binding RTX toxin-like protein